MQMNFGTVKKIVGVFCAAAVMSSVFVPVSVLAMVSEEFPEVPISLVQMLVALPSLIAIISNFIIAKLATRFYKRYTILACSAVCMVAGMVPFFFHGNFYVLHAVSVCVGLGMGGIQNGVIALIADSFEGGMKATVMGMLSLAIGLGALVFRSVSAALATSGWNYAYLSYLILVPLFLLEVLCLPKGKLEAKAEKSERAAIPNLVVWIAVFGFAVYLCYQMFDANVSLLVSERSLGGTTEIGVASSINAVATMLTGLFIVPFAKLFKNQSMTVTFVIMGAGCACMMLAQNVVPVCIAAVCMAMSNALFTVRMNQTVTDVSAAMGMSFNIAFVSCVCNLGQALSPLIMSGVSGTFGGSIYAKFAIAVALMAVCAVAGFMRFRKEA